MFRKGTGRESWSPANVEPENFFSKSAAALLDFFELWRK